MKIVFPPALASALAALVLGGCAAPPSDLSPERQIQERLGTSVEVRVDSEALEASSPAHTETLALAHVAATALRHDPRIQAALARYRVALAEARQERLLPNPVLSLTVRLPEGGGKPSIETGLAADLVAILRRPGKIEAADDRLRVASAEVLVVALDTVRETEEAYLQMQTLQQQMPLLQRQQDLLGRLLALAQARLEAGEATALDVSTVQSQRVELDLELARKGEALRQQELALAKLLGRPAAMRSWVLAAAQDTFNAEQFDESVLVAAALDRRPELLARQWELAALGGDLKAARLGALEGSEAGVDAERDDGWSVGPSLSVPLPLFDWGQARREGIRARRSEAAHTLTEASRVAVQEIRQALASLRAAQFIASQVQQALLPLAQKRQEQAEAEYRTGMADITALVLAEQELQSAQMQVVQAQGDAALAESRLRRACGGVLPPVKLPGLTRAATTQVTSD